MLEPGTVTAPDAKMVLDRDLLGEIADGLLLGTEKVIPYAFNPEADHPGDAAISEFTRAVGAARALVLMLHAGATS